MSAKRMAIVISLATMLAWSSTAINTACAQTLWTAGTGNWNTPANWTLGVPNAASPTAFDAIIGNGGTAQLLTAGGSVRRLRVGVAAGAGHLLLNGGGLTLTENLHLNEGSAGPASMTVQGASTVTSPVTVIGHSSTANTSLLITGANTVYNATTSFIVGRSGAGTASLTVNGGGVLASGTSTIGSLAGSTGNATVSGLNSRWSSTGAFAVGGSGTGTLTIQDQGTVQVGANLTINGTSRVNLNSGALNIADSLTMASGSILALNGGTLNLTNFNNSAGGTFTFNSGELAVNGGTFTPNAGGFVRVDGATPTDLPHLRLTNSATGTINGNFLIANGDAGRLTIEGGSSLNVTGAESSIGNFVASGNGTAFVRGNGSTWTNSGALTVGSTGAGRGNLEISDGGIVTNTNASISAATALVPNNSSQVHVRGGGSTWTSNGSLTIGTNGVGILNITEGGHVSSVSGAMGSNAIGVGTATVRGASSTWSITSGLVVGASGMGTLNVQDQAMVDIGGGLTVGSLGTVNLTGGTIRFNTLTQGGSFNFHSGTVRLPGNREIGLDPAITQLFGGAPVFGVGKGLTIEGAADFLAPAIIDGGALTVDSLSNGHRLQLQQGALNITSQAIAIGGGPLGDVLDLTADMTVNVALGITNHGLVTGDGRIGGTFQNAANGELRASSGRSLQLTGANNTNAGQIKLLGGELEFLHNVTNNTGALISGNGTLITGSGLSNHGTMNFAGTTNIIGNVTNSAAGKIISGGGGATIFYDDVVNQGEIRTSTNGFSVFFGSVSGAGTFTGTGTVNLEGDLNPGNSAAAIQFGGDLVLGPDSVLRLELGGTTAGTLYDHVTVGGGLSLDGTLNISLIDDFTPAAGQSFDILDWGSLAGEFADVNLPNVAGLTWDTSQLYTTGTLHVVAAGLPGDFNHNGTVDAADYVVWRNGLGTSYTQAHYDVWRANFGRPLAAASSGGMSPVPEPAAIAPLLLGIAVVSARRCR